MACGILIAGLHQPALTVVKNVEGDNPLGGGGNVLARPL